MSDPQPSPFRFVGGHVALDLTATLTGRFKATTRERLVAPADLSRWLADAGLSEERSDGDGATLAAARDVREAIYALALARIAGGDDAVARETLNAAAALPAAAPRLEATRAILVGPADFLVAHIAREAVRLFGGEHGDRIRQCEGNGCATLFLDVSRSGDRRWCSMKGCGNRAKVAEFRRRQRDRQSSS